MVFATAKSRPSAPVVMANIGGSMIGEASQNAMTALSGAPMARSAAMKGMTSQEQKGDRPPTSEARMTIRTGAPVKARATTPSAPDAFR